MALKDQIGSFSWFNLMSTDVEKANPFYKELFNWTFSEFEIPGMGKSTIYNASEMPFGNPVPLDPSMNLPSHWISYIAVENVDESCERAKTLGGKVCADPFDLPTIGRTAVITDPAGAAFHLFTPENKEDDMNMTGNKPGQICWMELMVDNPSDVLPFYTEMFNWKVSEPMEMNGGAYYSIEINGEKLGGFFKRPPEVPAMPPSWMPYFTVTDVAQSSSQVTALGGKVHMNRVEIPETGYFSLVEDPSGAFSYLFQSMM